MVDRKETVSDLVSSYVEEQFEIMGEWDADAVVETLGISTQELLTVPEFRNRAEQWIKNNCP